MKFKKVMIPLLASVALLASCSGTKNLTDSSEIAKATFSSLVSTCNNVANNSVNVKLSNVTIDGKYLSKGLDVSSKLSNCSLGLKLEASNLDSYVAPNEGETEKDVEKVKAKLDLYDFVLNGTVIANHKRSELGYITVDVDNLKIDHILAYLNRNLVVTEKETNADVKHYAAYADLTDPSVLPALRQARDIVDNIPVAAYSEAEGVKEEVLEKINEAIAEISLNGRYYYDLEKTIQPVLQSIVKVVNKLRQTPSQAEQERITAKIKTGIDVAFTFTKDILKNEKAFTVAKNGDELKYTAELTAADINKLSANYVATKIDDTALKAVYSNLLASGSITASLSTDKNGKASNLTFAINGLKTNKDVEIVKELDDKYFGTNNYVYLNNITLNLSVDLGYSVASDFDSTIENITSTGSWYNARKIF